MAFLKFKWVRNFVRKNTNPIEYTKALFWKEKLSIGYMLLAWNAFGMVCYMVYTGRGDWAKYYGLKSEEEMRMSPAQQFAKTLKIEKARVITFSGFRKTGEYDIVNDFSDESSADGTVGTTSEEVRDDVGPLH